MSMFAGLSNQACERSLRVVIRGLSEAMDREPVAGSCSGAAMGLCSVPRQYILRQLGQHKLNVEHWGTADDRTSAVDDNGSGGGRAYGRAADLRADAGSAGQPLLYLGFHHCHQQHPAASPAGGV